MPPPSARQQGFKQQTIGEKVEEYKRDLDELEDMLVSLRREYDLFFAGARRPNRPPFEMRSQTERKLRKWRTSTIQKLELTFRLNTLNSKFNAMVDVWDKIMKRREFDPKALSPFGPSADKIAAEYKRERRGPEAPEPEATRRAPAAEEAAASAGATAAAAARAAASAAAVDPETRLRRVYDQYIDAKKDLGETVDALSFSKFRGQLEKQVGQIRDKTHCKDVEFSVVRKNGKVSLTAKPIAE